MKKRKKRYRERRWIKKNIMVSVVRHAFDFVWALVSQTARGVFVFVLWAYSLQTVPTILGIYISIKKIII